MQNILQKIHDPKKREQITSLCRNLQILHKELTRKEMDEKIQELNLPLSIHLFITGNYSELMALTYSNPSPSNSSI